MKTTHILTSPTIDYSDIKESLSEKDHALPVDFEFPEAGNETKVNKRFSLRISEESDNDGDTLYKTEIVDYFYSFHRN